VRFAGFTGTTRTLRLLLPVPPSLRTSGGTTAAPALRSDPSQAHDRSARRIGGRLLRGRKNVSVEADRSPRFPGNPVGGPLGSSTPAGPSTPGRYGVPTRPPPVTRTWAPATSKLSGLNRQAQPPRCLRFAARVSPGPRKTRFRLLAGLYRAGLVTRRVPTKGFRGVITTSHPPFLSLPGATSPLPRACDTPNTPDDTSRPASMPLRLRSMCPRERA
jgi:hypothetical protein